MALFIHNHIIVSHAQIHGSWELKSYDSIQVILNAWHNPRVNLDPFVWLSEIGFGYYCLNLLVLMKHEEVHSESVSHLLRNNNSNTMSNPVFTLEM